MRWLNPIKVNSTHVWGALVCLFLFGCASLEPNMEIDPTVLAEPTKVEHVTAVIEEPTLIEPTAVANPRYPAPSNRVELSEAYPQPLAQPQKPYPEPEVEISQSTATQLKVEVIKSYPHSNTVFTQGLLWADGYFYESGGLYGQSALYRVGLDDGMPLQQVSIDESFFAEGIALVDDRIIMLTWQEQTALVFDKQTFEEVGRFSYSGQGWGLCFDESSGQLWMSDGSERIVSRNPETFEVTGEITVTLNGNPIAQINELECVDELIYANLWKSDRIVGINSKTGYVEVEIDAAGLLSAEEQAQLQPGRHVLNGIAYNQETGRFYLTGKKWPKLYEVEFR